MSMRNDVIFFLIGHYVYGLNTSLIKVDLTILTTCTKN